MLSSLLPLHIQESFYRRKFLDNRDQNLFMGSFESFAAAKAAVPRSLAGGYDSAEDARQMYSHQINARDYPALFWLERSLAEGLRSVFDLGGHVGIKYYAFRRVLPYPQDLRWTVCDVPGVVKTGRELAQERKVQEQLGFCTDFHEASGCELLYLSGSLQYLPTRLHDILAALAHKPRRIVLNTTAMHPERTLYTLNSIGFAVCPYRIHHHDALFQELAEAGYRRRDAWRNEGKPIQVPFVPGGDKAYYAGGCFDKA